MQNGPAKIRLKTVNAWNQPPIQICHRNRDKLAVDPFCSTSKWRTFQWMPKIFVIFLSRFPALAVETKLKSAAGTLKASIGFWRVRFTSEIKFIEQFPTLWLWAIIMMYPFTGISSRRLSSDVTKLSLLQSFFSSNSHYLQKCKHSTKQCIILIMIKKNHCIDPTF